MEPIRVQFDATVDDFIDVTFRSYERAGQIKPAQYALNIASWSFVACMAVPWELIYPKVPRILIAFITAIILGLWNFFTYKDKYRKNLRLYFTKAFAGSISVPVEVEINEFGVQCKQLETISGYAWSKIARVEENENTIYVIAKENNLLSVRKRGFSTEKDAENFLSALKRRIEPNLSHVI